MALDMLWKYSTIDLYLSPYSYDFKRLVGKNVIYFTMDWILK